MRPWSKAPPGIAQSRVLLLLILLLCGTFTLADTIPSFSGTNSGTVTGGSASQFHWEYGYGLSLANGVLTVGVDIVFEWDPSITDTQKEAAKQTWKNGITGAWNGMYELIKDDTYHIPIIFVVNFGGDPYTVHVSPGAHGQAGAKTTMTNWHIEDWGLVAAHEFGHMLGLYDEYTTGAIDPSGHFPAYDPSSLMGSVDGFPPPTLYERHFLGIRDWVDSHDPTGEDWELHRVPEPVSLVLFASGFCVVAVARRRLKR